MSFLGLQYPITKNTKGFFRTQRGINQIKSDLIALLLTHPGERVMLPEFGTPLKNLIFEPNDGFLEEEARNMIIESIRTWEPRITVEEISVFSSDDDGNSLNIKIKFLDPENIKEIQELRLEIPL